MSLSDRLSNKSTQSTLSTRLFGEQPEPSLPSVQDPLNIRPTLKVLPKEQSTLPQPITRLGGEVQEISPALGGLTQPPKPTPISEISGRPIAGTLGLDRPTEPGFVTRTKERFPEIAPTTQELQQREAKKIEKEQFKVKEREAEQLLPQLRQQLKEAKKQGLDTTELEKQVAFTKAQAQPLSTGLNEALSFGLFKKITGKDADIESVLEQPKAKIGEISGTVGRQVAAYFLTSGILNAVQSTAQVGEITSQLSPLVQEGVKGVFTRQGTDLLIDTIAQAPTEVIESIEQDKTLDQAAKDFIKNRAIDVAFNMGIEGIATGIKALKTKTGREALQNVGTTPEAIETAVKTNDTDLLNRVRSQLGIKDAGVTTQAVKKVEPEAITKQIDINSLNQIPESAIKDPVVGESAAKFVETSIKSDATGEELKQLLKQQEATLPTTSNEARLALADQIIQQNPDAALALVKSGEKFSSSTEGAIGHRLYSQLQQQGRFDDSIDVINALSKKFRKAGQEVQIASLWSKTTPQGMEKWAVDTLGKADIKIDESLIKQIGDEMRFIEQADVSQLKQAISDQTSGLSGRLTTKLIDNASQQRLKDLNIALTMKKVTDKLPISVGQKLSTFQAISHLLNGRTMARNILGNSAFSFIEQVAKVPAGMADSAISLATKQKSITSKFPKFKQAFGVATERGRRSLEEVLLGVEIQDAGKYDLFKGETFKNPILNTAEKALSVGLKVPDEFYKGFVQSDSVYNQVRSRLGKQVDDWNFGKMWDNATDAEKEIARNEALYTTFQDNSAPAKFMTKAKDALNTFGIGGARGLEAGKDFGLGDLVIKYTRVPGNIISRGFEYSPLGYLKLAGKLGEIANLPNITRQSQREIAQTLGRATTGTGLASLGYTLAQNQILQTQDKDRNLDANALERSEGLGNYKINLDGLKRFVNGEDPTPQAGDKLASYNWAQPVASPIAVGAAVFNQHEKDGTSMTKSLLSKDTLNTTMEEVLDLPTLYTIKSMFYESQSDDATAASILTVPLVQSVSGFVPSVVRQAAQIADPTFRDTRGETLVQEGSNKVLANIPGASKQLEPRLSPLGEPLKREGGLSSLIDPGIQTTFQPTGLTEDLKTLEDVTGETTQFPARKAPPSVSFKGQTLELTPEEKTLYLQTSGRIINEQYNRVLQDVDVEALTPEQSQGLVKILTNLERQAREFAKQEMLENRGVQ